MPPMSPGLLALTDQAEASLRELLGAYPSYLNEFHSPPISQAAALVAVDVLAALSECWEESVEKRLDVVTARLLAWRRIAS